MRTSSEAQALVREAPRARDYGTTILRAARRPHFTAAEANAVALADELRSRSEVEALAVLDGDMRPLGVLSRDRLFGLLGKPFGREVLGRCPARELVESAPLFDGHAGLFSAAASFRRDDPASYAVLVDADGRFLSLLAPRDIDEYLARMTQEDIELAGRVQERLSEANEALGGEGYRFEAWTRPAKGVGGDFWYSRKLSEGKAFFALCDVSGKGVAASLVVSLAWGMLRMFDHRRGLVALVKELNEALVATFHLEKYLTGFFAVFDPETRILEVADMGHAHALLFREGRARRLKAEERNLPVGIEQDIEPLIHRWRLKANDALLVFSDGLPEQEDAQGREFGEPELAACALSALVAGTALRKAIPEAIDLHRGRTPQQDDMSFVLLVLAP